MSSSTEELLPLALVRRWSSRRRGRGRPVNERSATFQANYDRLTQYGNRCDWLKDDKFLRDLEGDSVDTEILDEELRSLQEDEPQTCRGKSVKFLESNPLQIVLCVLVLIDAGVVVAEILLDLHAIRGQYREANEQLHQVLNFIKEAHADELHGYHGNNVGHILELLHGFDYNSSSSAAGDAAGSGGGSGSGLGSAETRDRRHLYSLSDMLSLHLSPRLHEALVQSVTSSIQNSGSATGESSGENALFNHHANYDNLNNGESDPLLQHHPAEGQGKEHQSSNIPSSSDSSILTSSSTNSGTGANQGNAGIYTAADLGNIHNTRRAQGVLTSSRQPPTPSNSYLQTAMRLLQENIRLKAEIAKLYSGIRSTVLLERPEIPSSSEEMDREDLMVYRDLADHRPVPEDAARGRRDAGQHPGTDANNRHVVHRHNHNLNHTRGRGATNNNNNNNAGNDHFNSYASGGGESRESDFVYTGVVHNTDYNNNDGNKDDHHKTVQTKDDGGHHDDHHPSSAVNVTHFFDDEGGEHAHTQAEKLKEIAHILHFCSIGILGIFVAQLFLKLFGMGITEFFKKKMEIFDAVIILASFALDLVFLEGIGGAQGEEAAALLIVFLLWRILRVINGIMVTAKKRQEFRIKLQKRARRRGDKKVELLEEDKILKEKEIAALRELCARRGADEDEIKACKPRRKSKSIMPRMDTSMGLTSVASLSLSLSMSMSGGAFNSIARSNPILNRRDSMQDQLPAPGRHPRRSSLLSSKPIEILQNHFRGSGGDKSPRTSGSLFSNKRMSMEKVVEEKEVENGGEDLLHHHHNKRSNKDELLLTKRNTLGDAIKEGSGEANLALLDHHLQHHHLLGSLSEATSANTSTASTPAGVRKTPSVTFDVENEVDDRDCIVVLPFDACGVAQGGAGGGGSMGSTPSPSRSEHSQSTTSMANGPVRRASTSSRHSNNNNNHNDEVIIPVTVAAAAAACGSGSAVTTQPLCDISMHQCDVITHAQQHQQQQLPVQTQPQRDIGPVVDVTVTVDAPLHDVCDVTSAASPQRGDVSSLHHEDVASHLNEVTTHLDDVSTHLDDVATHLNDVTIAPTNQDDDEFSSSSDSEGHETTRL